MVSAEFFPAGIAGSGPLRIWVVIILISAISNPVKRIKNIQKVICTEVEPSCETAAMVGRIS